MTLDSRSLLSYVDRGLVLNFTRAPPQASLKVLQTQLGGLAVDQEQADFRSTLLAHSKRQSLCRCIVVGLSARLPNRQWPTAGPNYH